MQTLGKGRILLSSQMEWDGERLHPATQIGAQFEIPFSENHILKCYALSRVIYPLRVKPRMLMGCRWGSVLQTQGHR